MAPLVSVAPLEEPLWWFFDMKSRSRVIASSPGILVNTKPEKAEASPALLHHEGKNAVLRETKQTASISSHPALLECQQNIHSATPSHGKILTICEWQLPVPVSPLVF